MSSLPPTSASPSLRGDRASFPYLGDGDLAAWLKTRFKQKQAVLIAVEDFRCYVADLATPNQPLFLSDPAGDSLKILKKMAGNGLLKTIDLKACNLVGALTVGASWPLDPLVPEDVVRICELRKEILASGRGKAISPATANRVWLDAAGRCMYRGCCRDLSTIPLSTKIAKAGYLAHIVASDPRGPRGDPATSHALSDSAENIMLMCDEHHRLVDRIDEAGHPTNVLVNMREERVRSVRSALDGLGYPRTKPIAILGNLANVPTVASESNMRAAILAQKLAPMPDTAYLIRRTQRDARLTAGFWEGLLVEHRLDIQQAVGEFGTQQFSCGAEPPAVLAVFPLHLVPILVLAGRIAGEARPIEVFQYDRSRQSWSWNNAVPPQAEGSFQALCSDNGRAEEVLLSLELTATVDEDALPVELVEGIRGGAIPWVRVTAMAPAFDCIRRREDLEQFTIAARTALKCIQDNMRATHVHLIGVSPASTLFRFGQLLQAGHHARFTVYDRPDGSESFRPGLVIDGQKVYAAGSPPTHDQTIHLR